MRASGQGFSPSLVTFPRCARNIRHGEPPVPCPCPAFGLQRGTLLLRQRLEPIRGREVMLKRFSLPIPSNIDGRPVRARSAVCRRRAHGLAFPVASEFERDPPEGRPGPGRGAGTSRDGSDTRPAAQAAALASQERTLLVDLRRLEVERQLKTEESAGSIAKSTRQPATRRGRHARRCARDDGHGARSHGTSASRRPL